MYLKLRYIIILIALCGLMTSCTSDTTAEPDAGAEVEVTFVTADPSRAVALSGINTEGSTFAIYGDMKFMNSDRPVNVFGGNAVTYRSGKWTYEDTQYWFPQHEHSFIAMHPAGATGLSETEYSNSQLSFTYTLPDNFEDARDLLVATHRRMYSGMSSSANPVMLRFWHIMSRINFMMNCYEPADKISVSIELQGVNKTGTFSIIPAPLSSGGEQTNDYIFSWTDLLNNGTFSIDVTDIDTNEEGEAGTSLFPDNNALFMIPQPDNKDIIMKITCTLYDADAEPVDQFGSEMPIAGWKAGKMYTYSLTVQPSIKDIYIDHVNVKEWKSGSDNNIDVPRK
ncbi:MAG: fimbrillin family protein [Muribaculaceae bacterium]|nr:fimbrillin family protein [Muribaculaceae bacterium]